MFTFYDKIAWKATIPLKAFPRARGTWVNTRDILASRSSLLKF